MVLEAEDYSIPLERQRKGMDGQTYFFFSVYARTVKRLSIKPI